MSKSNNSHKILKSVALAGALTAAGAVATTTAHADTTVTNDAPSQVPAEAATADQQLAKLKSQQTANENTVAQNNQAAMASATNAANDQIADLNAQIQQRQGKVASETAQVNADASSAIDQENATYLSAVASQQAANDAELKAAQAKIVTPAQKDQQTAQENADYQSKASNLNIAHDQNLNKIDADYQNQTKQVNQEIANVQSTIKADHDQAVKSATTNVDNQINAANDTVNTAQKAVNDDQTNLNNLQKAAQATTSSTSNTDIPTNTKGFIDHYNPQKFELPKAYVNNLHNVHDIASSNQFEQTINPNMKMFKMFDYQSDPDAAKEKVDVLHLTGQQILQLNLYSTRLINQIRAQFGMPAFKLNPQSIANAQRMANQESAGKMSGHHLDILKGAGENVGSFSGQITQDSTQKQMSLYKASGEHPDVWVKRGPNDTRLIFCWVDLSFKTMDDLQAGLFYTVTAMMFADSGQEACGHALNFSLWNQSPDSQMALGIESFVNDNDPKEGSVYYRWIFTNSRQINPKNNLDTTPTNAHGANIAQNNSAQIKSAQTALANAKKDLSNAQKKLNTLTANRDQMIQDLVDKTKTDDSAVQKLQAKLKDIKASHDKAVKDENAKYNAELNKLNQAHQAKLDAVKAQSSDVNVNELKAQLQKKLDTLKVNHEAKLAQIQKDADAKIAKIKAAAQNDPEIAKLQNRIATIKANLAAQKKSLDDQYAALVASDQAAYQKLENQLKSSASEGVAKGENDSYTTADGKTVVLPHESATTDSKTAVLAHDSTVTDDKPVALSHKTGGAQTTDSVNHNTVVRPEVATTTPIATAVNTIAPTMHEELKAQHDGKLPQTGNQSSLAAIFFGVASVIFSFGLAAKKR